MFEPKGRLASTYSSRLMSESSSNNMREYLKAQTKEFEIDVGSEKIQINYDTKTRTIIIEHYLGEIEDIFRNLRGRYLFDYAIFLDETTKIIQNFGRCHVIQFDSPDEIESLQHIEQLFKRELLDKDIVKQLWDILDSYSKESNNITNNDLIKLAKTLFHFLLKHFLIEQFKQTPDWIDLIDVELDQRYIQVLKKLRKNIPTDFEFAQLLQPSYPPRYLELLYEMVIIPLIALNKGDSHHSDKIDLRILRKGTGSFYTPQEIAHRITSRTLSSWLKDQTNLDVYDISKVQDISESVREEAIRKLKEIRIIDPAVGAGAFLLAAAEWLFIARRVLGDTTPKERIRAEIVTNNLHGVDIQVDSRDTTSKLLLLWSGVHHNIQSSIFQSTIKCGNSLIGSVRRETGFSHHGYPFDWWREFPAVMKKNQGFDVVLGNPPYGNIIDPTEKTQVLNYQICDVSSGRTGSWNAAPLFVVRSTDLLRDGGFLGLLLPNSILRVTQFTKVRKFILDNLTPIIIIDEARPLADVTLEMFSFIAKKAQNVSTDVDIISKRTDVKFHHSVSVEKLRKTDIIVMYYDDLLDDLLRRGKIGLMKASRGADIPKKFVRTKKIDGFHIPYITSGRSVKKFRIDQKYLRYANEWYHNKPSLLYSYENELLVATKNYPFPRCMIKSPGMIHGGGIVSIEMSEEYDSRTVGLILNSRLIQYICVRYFTNYSQLTTCLNTGIMENIPIIYPDEPKLFKLIFNELETIYKKGDKFSQKRRILEEIANALVYELYLFEDTSLSERLSDRMQYYVIGDALERGEILSHILDDPRIKEIFRNHIVKRIETAPRMNH
ncbi:MAG: hypothetical protein BAJATHORv1_30110 [Candidatus Thorarchaeota archaeon]|nr:MAG: hypothetical protein BAJATHORv1_30110 [Candidatus Thorarchaeota archaeon]